MPPSDSSPPQGGTISRRGFLKGAGAGAAGAALLHPVAAAAEERWSTPVLGPGAVPVTLRVNGADRAVQVEPRDTLASVLRDTLGMTGTKVVCDRGACSGCTVWLDGTPVNSCMTLAIDVGGREITTIEGLAKGGELHPVQAAFVEHDASQCGFCTPGMVMSCAALLTRNPNPTLDDVRTAVAGNLCRCATYNHVFEAALTAAARMRGAAAGG